MKNIDRGILLALACGVWFLVLKPTAITAHDGMFLNCYIKGEAYGSDEGSYIIIHNFKDVHVNCRS